MWGVVVLLGAVAQPPLATKAAEVLLAVTALGSHRLRLTDVIARWKIGHSSKGAHEVVAGFQTALLFRIIVSLVGAGASSPLAVQTHVVLGAIGVHRTLLVEIAELERYSWRKY